MELQNCKYSPISFLHKSPKASAKFSHSFEKLKNVKKLVVFENKHLLVSNCYLLFLVFLLSQIQLVKCSSSSMNFQDEKRLAEENNEQLVFESNDEEIEINEASSGWPKKSEYPQKKTDNMDGQSNFNEESSIQRRQVKTNQRKTSISSGPIKNSNPVSNPTNVNSNENTSGPNMNLGQEKTMEQFLDRLLHESVYDKRIRPFYTDSKNSKPVIVTVNINVLSITDVSEVKMEYTVDCYFRQVWYDPRLMYSNSSWKDVADITLHYDLVSKVWTPDAFFRNLKDGKLHMITVPNRMLRIHPDGKVLFSQRMNLRLECIMKLQKYPLDNQTCTINIGSYAYLTKDIEFEWSETNALQVNHNVQMPDFILENRTNFKCNRSTATGAYACLEVHFYLKRQFVFYFLQIYLPSILTCFISFVSFWIDHKAVPARISVGLLTVLTITTQSSGIRGQLPKVSYIKAIDVWMTSCLIFVFAALLEYALVNVYARKNEFKKNFHINHTHKAAPRQNTVQRMPPVNNEKVLVIGNRLANLNAYKKADHENAASQLNNSHDALEALLKPNFNHSNSIQKSQQTNNSLHVDSAVSISGVSQQSTPPALVTPLALPIAPPPPPPPPPPASKDDAQMIDLISSFLFPISFILFNIIYWMVYLNMEVLI